MSKPRRQDGRPRPTGHGRKGQGRGSSAHRGRKEPEHCEEEYGVVISGQAHGHSGRKRLDPATKSYFLEIASLLKTVADEDERGSICIGALRECRGQELPLACDAACGRVLETLVSSCEVGDVVEFLHNSSHVAVGLAVDPGGSHVFESALKAVGRNLLDESSRGANWFSPLEETLRTYCQKLGADIVDVMTSRYGSHSARTFLSLLSGNTGALLAARTGDMKSVRTAAAKTWLPSLNDTPQHEGVRFPELLQVFARKILETTKGCIAQLRSDESGSLVLQALLKALHGDEAETTQIIAGLFDCQVDDLTKDSCVMDKVMEEDVIAVMEDRSSSHLMEVIIQSASDSLYVEIFNKFFRKRLLQLSLHGSANFVVQALLSCARHEGQVNIMFEELEGHLSELVFKQRAGVIAALLAACGRFQTKQREASRTVASALNANQVGPADLVTRLLYLESARDGAFPAHIDSSCNNRMSFVGSFILQTILNFPKECSQQFCASIAALEAASLLTAVRDPSGSRVLEAFLDGTAAPPKHKKRVITKLEGHFAELALHPIGCFVVEKSFISADIKLKEKIVAELAPLQSELSKSRYGARIARRCDISGFVQKPELWRDKESTKQNTRKAFADLFSLEDRDLPQQEDDLEVSKVRQQNSGRHVMKPVDSESGAGVRVLGNIRENSSLTCDADDGSFFVRRSSDAQNGNRKDERRKRVAQMAIVDRRQELPPVGGNHTSRGIEASVNKKKKRRVAGKEGS